MGRNIITAMIVIGVSVSGCATESQERPVLDAATTSPSQSPEDTFRDLDDLAAALGDRSNQFLSDCMQGQGFPQLAQAAEMRVDRQPIGQRGALMVDPLEAGPYTEAQASSFGILGLGDAFRDDEPGYVVSRSETFDTGLVACQGSLAERAGADVLFLLQAFDELSQELRNRLVTASLGAFDELLLARFACVRSSGYPSLTVDTQASSSDLLASVEVPEGSFQENTEASPDAFSEPADGAVVVRPPDPISVYSPSLREIAFALTYVECGRGIDFVDRWQDAQGANLPQVLDPMVDQINVLYTEITSALEAISP